MVVETVVDNPWSLGGAGELMVDGWPKKLNHHLFLVDELLSRFWPTLSSNWMQPSLVLDGLEDEFFIYRADKRSFEAE